jgi:putative resolvase
MGFVTTRVARDSLGISGNTLRKWGDDGTIKCIRSPAGQRLYNIESFTGETNKDQVETKDKLKICYCRVSSQGQKDDLQRQVMFMQENFPTHTIVSDIGSGINFKRRGLRTVLEQSSKGLVSEVVVAYRDRLCRFAFDLLQWVFQCNGVKVVVYHNAMEGESGDNKELAEDLLAIINVFNCRVNGKRKYQVKAQKTENVQKEGGGTQANQKQEVPPVSQSRNKTGSKEVVWVCQKDIQPGIGAPEQDSGEGGQVRTEETVCDCKEPSQKPVISSRLPKTRQRRGTGRLAERIHDKLPEA